jgi:hypothetical protein
MSVPIRLLTLLVKKSALEQCYPWGLAGFRHAHPGAAEDEGLVAVPFMSGAELQQQLDTLRATGIDIARACAVGDAFQGPVFACAGIEFRALELADSPLPEWEAWLAG